MVKKQGKLTATKKPRSVKKATPTKKENTKNVQCFKEVKGTDINKYTSTGSKEVKAPKVIVDEEYVYNLIKAEVAVQIYENNKCEVSNILYDNWNWYSCSQDVANILELVREEHLKNQLKLIGINKLLRSWLIRSIISSLWLWATAMFLILK